MNTYSNYTWEEICSQPEAWSAALDTLKKNRLDILRFGPALGEDVGFLGHYNQIIFTGCGSTYYLALAAASLTQELTGMSVRAFPASELWLSPQNSYMNGKYLLVAVSRSGETTETLRACETFLSDERGDLLTLSCYEEMPLAKMGMLNIVLPSGQEQSVAQTRAFSTLYLCTVAMACLWAGRADLFDSLTRLPEAGARLLKNYAPLAADLGGDASFDRFYWLGSGPRYGLAAELSLKMKEMSLCHSEPFHFMEFRHGPKSMVTKSALIIGLRSIVNGSHETAVFSDLRALGGMVIDIAETDSSVQFKSNLNEAIRNVLYLPVGQMIAFERSISKGLNPDCPMNLDAVVKLS